MSQNQLNLNDLHTSYVKDPLLVDEFATELRKYVLRIARAECGYKSTSTIEDVVGESLLDVWKGLGAFNAEKSKFTSWVYTIVLRNIVDSYRKYNKRQEIELSINIPHPEKGPSKLIVQQLMDYLGEKNKSFILKKLEGLSEHELADYFGKNPKWAKNKWHRLAKKVRLLASADESLV